jgi:hypothetical protein
MMSLDFMPEKPSYNVKDPRMRLRAKYLKNRKEGDGDIAELTESDESRMTYKGGKMVR